MKRILFMAAIIALSTSCLAQKTKTITMSTAQNPADAKEQKVTMTLEKMAGADMPLREALQLRQTNRKFVDEPIDELTLSVMLAANGYNRPEERKRTAPSARNAQEIEIYLFNKEGVFKFNAEDGKMIQICKEDSRKIISDQKHFVDAPVALVLVANYDKMKDFSEADREFYSAVDCGYVSQNIYLYCASMDLGTVACGAIHRDELAKILKIKNGKVLLAHPVGRIAR